MTLQEAINAASERPIFLLFYFIIVPVTAWLSATIAGDERNLSPWTYLYSALLYLVCIPGIFAFALQIYLFLFERRSIMETNVLMELLPILSMVFTIVILRGKVDLDRVPGFGKLSGLITVIISALVIMWFIDRTRIIVLSHLPFQYLILILLGLILLIRYGWSKMLRS